MSPDGSVEIKLLTPENIALLASIWNSLVGEKNPFINYSTTWNRMYYSDENINWLKTDYNGIVINAPFEVLYDYRQQPVKNWGTYHYKGEFALSPKLAQVKEEMLRIFNNSNKIYKNNSYCPRVSDIKITPDGPVLEIQKATYYDQVSTNLSIDYKHKAEIAKILEAGTLRDWDVLQSGTEKGHLPELSKSKLANTIGVAAGIITTNKAGREVVLLRKRTSSVAVNPGTLSLPLSFALNFDVTTDDKPAGTLSDLIRSDLRHEQAQELGLDVSELEFENIKPLLLCRELCRGGKPQFILEIKTRYTYEELTKKIKESPVNRREFTSKIEGFTIEDISRSKCKFSSDVLAFIVSKASTSRSI